MLNDQSKNTSDYEKEFELKIEKRMKIANRMAKVSMSTLVVSFFCLALAFFFFTEAQVVNPKPIDKADFIYDYLKWILPFSVALIFGGGWWQIKSIRKQVEDAVHQEQYSIKNIVTRTTNEIFDPYIKKLKADAELDFKRVMDIFLKMTKLQEKKYLLFGQLDIDEPSQRHPLSKSKEKEINVYIECEEEFDKAIAELKHHDINIDAPEIDYVKQGDAYHYLAIKDDQNKSLEYEKKAILNYKGALGVGCDMEGIEDLLDIQVNTSNYGVFRKLGNAYAGKQQHAYAKLLYEKSVTLEVAKSDPCIWVSWGDAHQYLLEFDDALEKYKFAIICGSIYKDKPSSRYWSSYWEAMYQRGNTYSAIGNYLDAIDSYEKMLETDYTFRWFFHSLGDAYRKYTKPVASISYYEKEITLVPNDGEDVGERDIRLGETFYKIGRALIDLEKYDEAIKYFKKAENHKYLYPLFYAFYASALLKINEKENKEVAKLKIEDAINKTNGKPDSDKAKQMYNLAVCYSLKDKQEALDRLVEVITEYPATKNWVKAANYSDFVTIKDEVKALVEPS